MHLCDASLGGVTADRYVQSKLSSASWFFRMVEERLELPADSPSFHFCTDKRYAIFCLAAIFWTQII